ncbi:BglG family transcription antiterminator [Enterococcus larvae]|uniref:BglG family transcription antiterminator n=1 Tax=Enterococcus larvae TaxID=2794352 RepID=UPI003F40C3A9
MDSMMKQIIELVLQDASFSSQRLMDELSLSKSQLNYRMKKINDYLIEKKLPSIKKENHCYLLTVDREQKRFLLETDSSLIHLQSDERQCYIILLIILYEQQTLGSLAEKLGVSRNTILADMKLVNKRLTDHSLSMKSTRARGYFLVGQELDIRKIWLYLLKKEIEKDFSLVVFKELLSIEPTLLESIYQRIEQLENELQLFFSEVKIAYLSMIIYLSIKRFSLEESIATATIEHYGKLLNQQTYSVVAALFIDFYEGSRLEDDEQELRFITMHILSINVVKRTSFRQNVELQQAIVSSIERFEKSSITFFENKKELCAVLYQHIIPASYRIRFGVPDENELFHSLQQEYQEFYSIVKKAVQPIEQTLMIEFIDEELAYLLIIFLGFLKGDKFQEQEKKTAIVVCMHGVSVSRLLLENLKELLPEIYFTRYMSLREFYEVNPKVDIIFSTVGVDTDIPSFFIKHFLTEEEKQQLKYKVEREVFGRQPYIGADDQVSMEKIISVIEKHATIHSKQLLREELDQLLFSVEKELPRSARLFKERWGLLELLPPQNIQIYDKPLSFEEAIRLCGKPLIQNGFINEKYVETIIQNYDPDYPYFVIAPEVAIPHAAPEDGVKRLGMSLLRVKYPIPFSNKLSVRVLVMIAPKDKKSHLNAVTVLYNLVNDRAFREQVLSAKYEQELHELFCKAAAKNEAEAFLTR